MNYAKSEMRLLQPSSCVLPDSARSGKAACIAVLGTGSDVGKSIVTTALCRIYAQRGVRVAPFKAQNMSNNSGITPEGLEMGRAQIVQAEAARIAPHVDMNPVLLKPTSDVGAQVVLLGRAQLNTDAQSYEQYKTLMREAAYAALQRLRRNYELIIIEGAGSCAEVNLLANDFINLPLAAHAKAPAILVADIHRGGVFAQVVGTLACLDEKQRAQIQAVIINRFRGDIELFRDGAEWIQTRTQLPVLGVLPWYSDFSIQAEDAVCIEKKRIDAAVPLTGPCIAVIRLPHISNFTDFEPLAQTKGLGLVYLEIPQDLSRFSAVILPGTKSTRNDLEWLASLRWPEAIRAYAEKGGHLLGICGGYQILGNMVHDPDGLEGLPGSTVGLKLLPVTTELKALKTTTRTEFSWQGVSGSGYEIHMGHTNCFGGRPLFQIHSRNQVPVKEADGCILENGHIIGTYLHGLFDTPAIMRRWLDHIGLVQVKEGALYGPLARDQAYDALAEHARQHLCIPLIDQLIKGKSCGE